MLKTDPDGFEGFGFPPVLSGVEVSGEGLVEELVEGVVEGVGVGVVEGSKAGSGSTEQLPKVNKAKRPNVTTFLFIFFFTFQSKV